MKIIERDWSEGPEVYEVGSYVIIRLPRSVDLSRVRGQAEL